jgi:hypothetical protein
VDIVTKLAKSIKRSVELGGIHRPVTVTLDGTRKAIGFQEKGCRTIYWLPLLTGYLDAIRLTTMKEK